jgi:uncharacterized protein (TIGR03663 family)
VPPGKLLPVPETTVALGVWYFPGAGGESIGQFYLQNAMTSKLKIVLLLFSIILVAAVFRLYGLSLRPMHTDEAVHAFKFGQLLENGTYIFDKNEYHGPTLNYLTLLPARLASYSTFASLDESVLRLVPALAGLLVVLILSLLARSIGWKKVLTASFLLAVSPPLVYYSRYYIHETLLVFFNVGFVVFLYRYLRSGNAAWIIASGVFGGLMVATKSTWVIIVAAQMAALFITGYVYQRGGRTLPLRAVGSGPAHFAIFLFSAGIVSVVCYSSFFSNPAGIGDSVTTYADSFHRAGPEGLHIHPWHYYIGLMVTESCGPLPFRADLWLLITGFAGMALTIAGVARAVTGKSNQPEVHPVYFFSSITALLTIAAFSVLPYKTPWNILAFYVPMVVLSAYFIISMADMAASRMARGSYVLIIPVVMSLHVLWQSYSDNFITYDRPCNPWTYAHPGKDVLAIAGEAAKAASVSPEGRNMYIEIIVPDSGYWPLPWYLRDFPNAGWWEEVNMDIPAAPFIICAPEYEPQLTRKLFEVPPPGQRRLYIPLLDRDPQLRPGVSVSLYLRKDYYDRYAEKFR